MKNKTHIHTNASNNNWYYNKRINSLQHSIVSLLTGRYNWGRPSRLDFIVESHAIILAQYYTLILTPAYTFVSLLPTQWEIRSINSGRVNHVSYKRAPSNKNVSHRYKKIAQPGRLLVRPLWLSERINGWRIRWKSSHALSLITFTLSLTLCAFEILLIYLNSFGQQQMPMLGFLLWNVCIFCFVFAFHTYIHTYLQMDNWIDTQTYKHNINEFGIINKWTAVRIKATSKAIALKCYGVARCLWSIWWYWCDRFNIHKSSGVREVRWTGQYKMGKVYQ